MAVVDQDWKWIKPAAFVSSAWFVAAFIFAMFIHEDKNPNWHPESLASGKMIKWDAKSSKMISRPMTHEESRIAEGLKRL